MLLHGLLVWALLYWTGRRSPEPVVSALAGVLLLESVARATAKSLFDDIGVPAPEKPREDGTRSEVRQRNRAAAPSALQGPPDLKSARGFDWYATGESVARESAARAELPPKGPLDRRPYRPAVPATRIPKSVFDEDASRVGRTTRNADGETLYWVSPNCYISLGSDSIALRDVHALHRGMTFCRIPLGKRKARGDLFDDMPTQRGSRYAEKYDPASTEPQPVR